AEEYLDVVPFQLKQYESCKFKVFKDFNEALDEFYLRVTVAEKSAVAQSEIEPLKREADKLKRVINEQQETIRDAEIQTERQKKIGDTIYAYSNEIQTLLDKFNDARTNRKDLNTIASDFSSPHDSGKSTVCVEGFDAKNMALNVSVNMLKFSLNLRKSLFENAAKYYEQGKKIKQKAAGASTALDESRQKLDDLERKIKSAETEQITKPAEMLEKFTSRRLETKEWFEKFHWFISSDGMLIVAGKDVVSNEVLVKKHAAKDDIVFHAEITGAPFVVVKTEGRSVTEQTLHEAGEYAAALSRAWREGLGSADVYWVTPDQLSKTGPSGEYVPHGAFFVAGKRNWMRGVPLRITIGIVDNDKLQFIGGPVDAIKTKAKVYITLVPGDVAGKDFLKQILRTLALKLPKEQREKLQRTSIEMIRELVPYTKGRIAEAS
ncbi:MAG: ribosome rescue protein RqcH, partial [Chloroflexota bacterium]